MCVFDRYDRINLFVIPRIDSHGCKLICRHAFWIPQDILYKHAICGLTYALLLFYLCSKTSVKVEDEGIDCMGRVQILLPPGGSRSMTFSTPARTLNKEFRKLEVVVADER